MAIKMPIKFGGSESVTKGLAMSERIKKADHESESSNKCLRGY